MTESELASGHSDSRYQLLSEGAVMKSNKHSLMKIVVSAAILGACVSGAAYADDSSMARFGGDSYAYFNSQQVDKSPSAWRQANPNGLSDRQLEAISTEAPAWQLNKPIYASAPTDPSFRQTHPNGLTEREYQALSSEAPTWHPSATGATAMASNGQAGVAQSANANTVAARLARVFTLGNTPAER
jgi:hypothetical protein